MNLSEHDELLLNAYLDGELSPIEAHRFERRLGDEPMLEAALEARRALRSALRADLASDVPSPQLSSRVAGLGRKPHANGSWRSLAASFILGTFLAGGIAWGIVEQRTEEGISQQIVSAHIRSLMSTAPTDVASSEHHTVKPWFNGKISFAPVVADLAAQGFPLVGARIDVVGLAPAATLVYRTGKHLISLTEMPNAKDPTLPVAERREQGYLALSWNDGQMAYWAISDAAAEELQRFVEAFRAAGKLTSLSQRAAYGSLPSERSGPSRIFTR
jgi:anti-sigma factor RsiW